MQATINGCRIHYEIRRHTDANAPRILLLHGWGCDSNTFSFIRDALAEWGAILTLDLPGHGQSGEPPEPWGVGEYAALVRALIEQESFVPVKIVAHSFGGRIAILLAAKEPGLVEQLVITGGAGIKKPVTERAKKRTQRFKRGQTALAWLEKVPLLSGLAERLQTKLRNHYGSPDYIRLNDNMRKTFVKVVTEDLYPLLSAIQAPTLLIWGGADTETPLWMGQAMEKAIPDAGLAVFEGGSHFAFLEQWQRFSLIVKQFFLEGNG